MKFNDKKITSILFFLLVVLHVCLDSILQDRSHLVVTKLLPNLILLAYTIQNRELIKFEKKFIYFILSLSLILFGDVCLLFPKYLSLGLLVYIVAQFIYSYIFFNKRNHSYVRLAIFLVYGILTGVLFLPKVNSNVLIPVIIYIVALMTMGYSVFSNTEKHFFLLKIGAILFIFSDTLLGYIRLNQIIYPIWNPIILLTYYSAQFGLILGSLNDEKR
ncbi:hypothetical protein EHQ96_06200 [Leptospira levettii]|uniref:lysoplasmalogenase family protein n=1 Tax=Leptospira levettii TaxID=2023178 RepID=UPI0010831FD4|nr:lysoplasmalogenase family protein [Leptospira levettii]TGM44674.1 hypothetical protein EHQ75_00010 [Leptospira levettii]TGM69133.1 hypothetical protein EHQ96_06200 [Leptospira levettii]